MKEEMAGMGGGGGGGGGWGGGSGEKVRGGVKMRKEKGQTKKQERKCEVNNLEWKENERENKAKRKKTTC